MKPEEKFIVQQCNYTGKKLTGLAKTINDDFEVNSYDRNKNDISYLVLIKYSKKRKILSVYLHKEIQENLTKMIPREIYKRTQRKYCHTI